MRGVWSREAVSLCCLKERHYKYKAQKNDQPEGLWLVRSQIRQEKWSCTRLIAAVKRHPMQGTSPMEIKPIAAQLRQQHWGFTAAGFVLEPGTMLNSVSPILHSRTLHALINQKCNHVTVKASLWPPRALSVSLSLSLS